MYIKRHLEKEFIKVSKVYPVIMLCGQRQVGKSTLLYHIKENNRTYVTLDDANARRLAILDPNLFFDTYGYPILIDEFQRAPSLLLEIKRIVDEKALKGEDNNGLFWLTSSQKFKMMRDVFDSLAGRIAMFELSTLSQAEIEEREVDVFDPNIDKLKERLLTSKSKDVHQIYEAIYKGGMPKIFSSNIDRDRYYMDYVNTYLERDIKDLAKVGKIDSFYDFLVYMASRTAQELKYDDIAKCIGISAPTAKTWASILERSGIIFILKPYSNSITKRLVKTPKVYFLDTALAAYLYRWPNGEQ